MAQGKFGFTEIVDTLTDAVRAEMKARETFKGKIDIIRVATFVLDQYPKVKEAVEDWPTFEAEIKDLFSDEGIQALEAIQANLTVDEMTKSRVLRVIRFAAQGYKNTVTVIDLGREQLALGAAIFA